MSTEVHADLKYYSSIFSFIGDQLPTVINYAKTQVGELI